MYAGVIQLASGLLSCLFTSYAAREGMQQAQEQPEIGTQLVILTTLFAAVSFAGIVVGVWNFATRLGSTAAPLVSAAVVSALSVALMVLGTSDPITHPIKLAWLIGHLLFIAWTVVVLRRDRLRTLPRTERSAPARS